jgi:hypothetical protein
MENKYNIAKIAAKAFQTIITVDIFLKSKRPYRILSTKRWWDL